MYDTGLSYFSTVFKTCGISTADTVHLLLIKLLFIFLAHYLFNMRSIHSNLTVLIVICFKESDTKPYHKNPESV